MNDENSTGKPARLSLAERARQGRLEQELSVADIVALEHFTNPAARNALLRAIQQAIEFSDLHHRPETTPACTVRRKTAFWPAGSWSIGNGDPPDRLTTYPAKVVQLIDREAYRAWRLTCPPGLLSPLSQIHKWLGATPALAESIPPETSLTELPGPGRLTEAQQDKADCQAIAYALWAEQPDATQADILKNSRIKPYLKKWPGKNTLPGWLSEIDPRPKEQRRGRPKAR